MLDFESDESVSFLSEYKISTAQQSVDVFV